MPRKRHKPEEIVAKLRQVDVLSSQGQSVAEAIRAIGVTEVTYYRWRQPLQRAQFYLTGEAIRPHGRNGKNKIEGNHKRPMAPAA
jgi:transposase-like protein